MMELPPHNGGPSARYGLEISRRSDWIKSLSHAELAVIEAAGRRLAQAGRTLCDENTHLTRDLCSRFLPARGLPARGLLVRYLPERVGRCGKFDYGTPRLETEWHTAGASRWRHERPRNQLKDQIGRNRTREAGDRPAGRGRGVV